MIPHEPATAHIRNALQCLEPTIMARVPVENWPAIVEAARVRLWRALDALEHGPYLGDEPGGGPPWPESWPDNDGPPPESPVWVDGQDAREALP